MLPVHAELRSSMMLPRTAKYIEALNRDGDKFDYLKGLQTVREEEAAKQRSVVFTSGESVVLGIANLSETSEHRSARIISGSVLIAKPASVLGALGRSDHLARKETTEARLRRRLEKVRHAWGAFQESRDRDAVHRYLGAAFRIVVHYKVRRNTDRLLRHAFKFAGLAFDKNADPFTAVIRCTCDDTVDNKTISKWARALRYVAYCEVPRAQLKKFMKDAGGVNACADRYARCYGRGCR